MSNKSISFAEFLFSQDIPRDPEDTVSKLARRFKADMDWDIHMVSKQEVENHVVSSVLTNTMVRIKQGLQDIVQGNGFEDLGQVMEKFNAELGASRMAVNLAWADYQKYLND